MLLKYNGALSHREGEIMTSLHFTHQARIAVASIAALAMSMIPLAGCGSSSSKGKVYYLNTKPEIVKELQDLGKKYQKETGVEVQIRTAASGTSNSTITSELGKKNGPGLFNLAGFDQYIRFRKFLRPLQNTKLYKQLDAEGKSNAFGDGKNVYTLPYAGEWYGIIYNKAILNKYVSKPYAVIKQASELKDYATLKKVAESMQEHKADLGIKGAFSTPGLDPSNNYRYAAHMNRVPYFFEMRDKGVRWSLNMKGTYVPQYKDLWDLELKNSPTDPHRISTVSYDDSTGEFARGEVVFYPNGVWSYAQIKGNAVKDEDLGMLPYWMGIKGEEKYGPFGVYDANWAINKRASKADQEACLKFLEWIVTSKEGRTTLSKEMGFSVPFTTFGDEYQPDNPLTTAAKQYQKEGKPSPFSINIPGQQYIDDLSNALLEYSQGTGKWNKVQEAFTKDWTAQWESYKQAEGMLPPAGKFDM